MFHDGALRTGDGEIEPGEVAVEIGAVAEDEMLEEKGRSDEADLDGDGARTEGGAGGGYDGVGFGAAPTGGDGGYAGCGEDGYGPAVEGAAAGDGEGRVGGLRGVVDGGGGGGGKV